jgi:type II secretory pathway component PulF
MSAFAYRAVDQRGNQLEGEADAPSPEILTRRLEASGLAVVRVGAASTNRPAVSGRGAVSARAGVLDVTRALAALLSAGLPLSRALAAAGAVTRGVARDRLADVRNRVGQGETLAAALAANGDVFPPYYVGLVRAAERTGDLDVAFTRLTAQLEREDELRSKLLPAAIYPTLLAFVGMVAVGVLMLFVLPRLAGLLEGAGAELPRSTAIMLKLSSLLQRYWPALLVPPVLVAAGAAWTQFDSRGARVWSTVLLNLPVIGRLRRDMLAARFARMMGVLLAGGAPLLAALAAAAESVADPRAREAIVGVRERVREGTPLHRAIAGYDLFPSLLSELTSLGEETGRLEDFLRKAADLFEQRTERKTARAVALAEPLMIVALGGVVGSIALSLLQAIYGMNAGSFR